MTNDVGIRPGADRPVETQVKTTTAKRLTRRCAHDRVAWQIGAQRWHAKSDTEGEENLLEPCGGKA
jgi:hypothetical protein